MNIPDIEVLDQDGRKLHFYTDLVRGKTLALNFIFTTCTTICPPLGATFARVQKDLGERTGRNVQPTRPRVLKNMRRSFTPSPIGWQTRPTSRE